ncbi:AsnC family transcriptional regulator [Sulfuricella sp. T08]|uniref:siroheme decarboxylase subunit beta n=1 Tax=Sulfuricella sp. T08 TaxID=1632857 RepID=UPI0006179BDD|nr:Lrp/AsnC family transcriptional regulator [Sulfuricella sp. T08]GAO37147.1 AsnC family transcriptional regulator [Sulfuricella sp. T08]
MTELELHLLNDYQRDFPLVPAPFGVIAGRLGVSEAQVLETLVQLQLCGTVSRVGAVFRPHSIGSSSLAAIAVPADKLEEAARLVSSYNEVNHNYEREHHYNLWFVVAAADEARVREVLAEIGGRTGCPVLHLPMLEDYHIDLGFDLLQPHQGRRAVSQRAPSRDVLHLAVAPAVPQPSETALIGAVQQGLPLVSRPFAEIGESIGLSESEVIAGLAQLQEQGVIKRIGVVVRHHELGYRANAMVVWDIPDDRVSTLGHCIGKFDFVTLCYQRPRRLPSWRYNLFCMIHGRDRDEVLSLVAELEEQCGLHDVSHEVLFSQRRFKQCGARYVTTGQESARSAQRGAASRG